MWQSTRTRAQDAVLAAAAARRGDEAGWENKEVWCEVEGTRVHFFCFATSKRAQQVEAPSTGTTVKLPHW